MTNRAPSQKKKKQIPNEFQQISPIPGLLLFRYERLFTFFLPLFFYIINTFQGNGHDALARNKLIYTAYILYSYSHIFIIQLFTYLSFINGPKR